MRRPSDCAETSAATGRSPTSFRSCWKARPCAETRRLPTHGLVFQYARWLPDGRLYPLDGGEPAEVPGLDGGEEPVGWIDRGLLAIAPGGPGYRLARILLVDPATGRRELWREIVPPDRAGLMSLGSFRVTPDGGAYAYNWHRAVSDLYLVEGLR